MKVAVAETQPFQGEWVGNILKRCFFDVEFQFKQNSDDDEFIRVISNNDIVKNVYQGGFKLWEASLDLANYLDPVEFNGKRVLELGCGAAIPGITAQKLGSIVDFQDYNDQVLRLLTIPNVAANLTNPVDVNLELTINSDEMPSLFFAGDWATLDIEPVYDIILTCETVYDAESIPHLFNLIQKSLKPNGVAYIAAKSHYFGCSGSLLQFKQLCKLRAPNCTLETVFTHKATVRREIVRLKF